MNLINIRNFAIISHIDHGKSTLADRFLELTGTVEKRKMKERFLDDMELEKEKGITIKMRPVRMIWRMPNHSETPISKLQTLNKIQNSNFGNDQKFVLNLIDTPGHVDFSYEVSRALVACEGAILLVDATQGIQAQTITNVELAKSLGLKIIPAVNKIDLVNALIQETKKEITDILECEEKEILEISAKTGQGVGKLLETAISEIPSPSAGLKPEGTTDNENLKALIFDFQYSSHKGVIAFVRIFSGSLKTGDELMLVRKKIGFTAKEVGFFEPDFSPKKELSNGEVGYVVMSLKEPSAVKVGDTIVLADNPSEPLPGYKEPKSVIWANIYPADHDKFDDLKKALYLLRLSDSAFNFTEEAFDVLGRGFRCGFLGMLHLEIISERIKREFKMEIVVSTPTVSFLIKERNGEEKKVLSSSDFPETSKIDSITEQWAKIEIIIPFDYFGALMKILPDYEGIVISTDTFSRSRMMVNIEMPLRELMRGFFDALKNISSGFASLNYEILGEQRKADVVKLDVLVAEQEISALSRVVPKRRLQKESENIVEKLKELLPRELFAVKVQARAQGRILASRTISALKKNVTGYLYGGDRTRKMKLWKKQKEGKKKLKERGVSGIPNDVFLKMLK